MHNDRRTTMNLDMNKVEQFAGQVVGDISATFSGVMTNIGHKLGLYRAMAGAGALTAQALADKTGTHERYVREWLNNQTAGARVADVGCGHGASTSCTGTNLPELYFLRV
jgi:hypothetical protein